MTHIYRPRVVEFEAAHLNKTNGPKIADWIIGHNGLAQYHEHGTVTGEPVLVVGYEEARIGDYIIRSQENPGAFSVMPGRQFENAFVVVP